MSCRVNGRMVFSLPLETMIRKPALSISEIVRQLSKTGIRNFHRDEQGQLQLRYVPLLMAQGDSLISPLLINIVDQLGVLFPEKERQLTVMRNNFAWKSVIRPAG